MEYVRHHVNCGYPPSVEDEKINHEYMRIYQAMACAEDYTSRNISSCYKQEELALEVV